MLSVRWSTSLGRREVFLKPLSSLLSPSFLFLLFLSWSSLFFTSCLYTHQQVKQLEKSEKVESNIYSVQKHVANQDAEFQEINENIRHINGQFEVIQKNIKDLQIQNQTLQKQMEERDKKHQENFRLLEQEIELLQSGRSKRNKKSSKRSKAKKNKKIGLLFQKANQYFKNKRWKQAIINFENYRQQSPAKNISFAHATYKIALSFDKLGMKEDAKTHFEELVRYFPRSNLAQKAKSYLNKM